MSVVFLTTFLGAACVLLFRGLDAPGRIYEFPFLAGAVFLGWAGPQAVGLLGDPRLPAGGLALTLIMATLCVAAVFAGHQLRPMSLRWLDWQYNERRLGIVAAGLSAVGATFAWKILALPEEMLIGPWRGLPVLYLLFAKLQVYGFAIAALLYARTRSKTALGIAVFNFLFFLRPMLIGARRALIIEIGLIVLLAAWFGSRRSLPRPAMVAFLLVGSLFVFSIGQYRGTVYEQGRYGGGDWQIPTLREVLSIDYWGNFQNVLNDGAYEVRNAVYDVSATAETFSFSFGATYWNSLVQDYVPRQVVGASLKESLKFDLRDQAREVYGHVPHSGTTHTGLSDTFRAFGFLGAMMFVFLSWFMKSLYSAGLRDNVTAQLLYMVLLTDGLLAITHGTVRFVSVLPHVGVFLLGGCWLARRRLWSRSRSVPERELARNPHREPTGQLSN